MIRTDTIAAVSTPRGTGGIAMIRISGGDAFGCAAKVFDPATPGVLDDPHHAHAYRGRIMRAGRVVDDVMATFFRAPHSYTGEDTVEITCHGGVLITQEVLAAVLAAGARPAEAGEFTRRAFTAGKLTLAEAESIGGMIHAKTRAQLALSSPGARDAFEREIKSLSDAVLELVSLVSVRIDYPEEDLADIGDDELLLKCEELQKRAEHLLSTYKTSRAVMDGVVTVICGRPNVGKSTLYNLFTGEDSAIVTDVPGTTRDTLTAEAEAGSVLLHLSDTAGIRETDDTVEAIGVIRARDKMANAELLISVHDASLPPAKEDRAIFAPAASDAAVRIAVINKTELPNAVYADEYEKMANDAGAIPVRASLLSGEGFDGIVSVIERSFTDGSLTLGGDAILLSARQSAEIGSAAGSLRSAADACRRALPVDIVVNELMSAYAELKRVDGSQASDEVIGAIFSKFCVGK